MIEFHYYEQSPLFAMLLVPGQVFKFFVAGNRNRHTVECPRCRQQHEFERLHHGEVFWLDCECGAELCVEVNP